ncbi:glycosyltransferase [Acetobacterium sp. K1/6]|uniref:glycosyltransferase n=1 Tax=Acetobacterium sp. K1/6 TaxID=3055467 RepID=UPI002ACA3C06|nr:glycosyltransferase [Acetobacterium sp. K1/6]MDZ5724895.1 glycosyltransferase [Acetobacterium sp. K1/6]
MNQENFDHKQKLKENIGILIENEKLDEAKELLELYEQVEHDDIEIYSMKGVIAMMEGDLDEAEQILQEGLKNDAYNCDLMYNLAYIYETTRLECKTLAIYYFNRCIEVTNDNNLRLQLEKRIQNLKENLYIYNKAYDKKPFVSIVILAYNKLEYTKMCVESLLKYTRHIDYELITVNNGSSDGTEEYFNSIPSRKKVNIRNNVGGVLGFNAGLLWGEGKYLVFVGNDLILTKNWLDNLLNCIQSDDKIGFVAPGSNILSNHQAIPVSYSSIEEMHIFAAKYNVSDPRKWEERLRNMPLTMVIKKELFDQTGGFDHRYYLGEFADDDFSFTIRRLGYKLIYAGDTFIHHFGSITGSEAQQNNNSLGSGSEIFKKKFNIDPWTEASFDSTIVESVNVFKGVKKIKILGINCFCGATPLQIKNVLLRKGIKNTEIINYTSSGKYEEDLKTVSKLAVMDRLTRISDYKMIRDVNYVIIESKFDEVEDIDAFIEDIKVVVSCKYQIIIKLVNPNYYVNIYNTFNNLSELKQTYVNLHKLLEKFQEHQLGQIETMSICEKENNENRILKSIRINGSLLSSEQEAQLLTRYYIISIIKS